MSSDASVLSVESVRAGSRVQTRPRFYLWMSVAMAATAFLGFAPTFWMPLAQGVPERIGVIAIHGTLFFGWTLFVIYQAWLASSGRIARHRDIGMIGISIATAMVIFAILTAIDEVRRADAAHFGASAESFMILPLATVLLFASFVTAALVNLRRAEWHKRLMIAATATILNAPIARPYIVYVVMGGHPPPFQGNVGLAGFPASPPPPLLGILPTDLAPLIFLAAGMIYDRRTRGKIHPAWWWTGGAILGVHLLKIPFSETALWHSMARGLVMLAG